MDTIRKPRSERRHLVFAGGLICAMVLAGMIPVAADSCQAFTAYGDCYIELTGCSGSCSFDPGENGEGSLSGTNCTGAYGECVGEWGYELQVCGGGSFYCGVHVWEYPLIED